MTEVKGICVTVNIKLRNLFFFNGPVVWCPQNGGAPSSCVALIAVSLNRPFVVKNLLSWDQILVLECVANVLPTKPHMMRFVELLKSDSQPMTRVPTGISKFEDEFLLAMHIFMLDLGLVTPAYYLAVLAHVKLTREFLIYVW